MELNNLAIKMRAISAIINKVCNLKLSNLPKHCQQVTLRKFNTSSRVFIKNHTQENLSDYAEDGQQILDVYKERLKYSPLPDDQEDDKSRFGDLNLARGLAGVFDIEDLVETLKHQQAEDLFVASVPKEIKYVDFIVVVSGRSQRHMQALAHFTRRVFKQKKHKGDVIPTIEGKSSPDWIAMDLGNIALHIFSKKARPIYDLDSLWALGSKYDDECNKVEPVSTLLESHSFSLEGLQPAR